MTNAAVTARAPSSTIDPAALHLAGMNLPPHSRGELSKAQIHRAAETLQRWRLKMAMWHDMPPAPPIDAVLSPARAALADHDDTRAALRLLHRLEMDHSYTSGQKYSTFAELDEYLQLGLTKLVGTVLR